MASKSGDQVRVGDALTTWFNGGSAQVKSLRPYAGLLVDVVGQGSQVASFHGTNVEMTLCAYQRYELA